MTRINYINIRHGQAVNHYLFFTALWLVARAFFMPAKKWSGHGVNILRVSVSVNECGCACAMCV